MRTLFAALLLGPLLLLTAPTTAGADVIDPAEEACDGRDRGDACTVEGGESGTCQPGECCRNDYSQGTPPQQVCSACLTCQPGGDAGDEDGCAAAPGAPGGAGALAVLAGLILAVGLRRSRR